MHVTARGICCRVAPLVAVTVTEYVPEIAPVAALSLRTLLPDPGAGKVAGMKVAETPLGNPVTEKVMPALKPPLTVVPRVTLLFDPAVTETALEAAAAWNAGVAVASFQWLARTEALTEPSPVT